MRQQRANGKFGAKTLSWPWPAFPIGAVVLLVGSFFYVWLRVEPLLEYHSYGPYFYKHRVFLEPFLDRPGGLVNYAGVFLAQFNSVSWLGALVFAMSLCAIFLAAQGCLARNRGGTHGVAARRIVIR